MAEKNDKYDILAEYIEERRELSFTWGTNDCCMFASDWILVATGKDPATDLRGTYFSALSAFRVLKKLGGPEKIAADRCAILGLTEVPILSAPRGALASVDSDHGPAMGVVVGARVAFAAERGLAFRYVDECRRAWRII